MKKFFEEFKAFAVKGNVVDMAVGVMVGGAFSKIVGSLVSEVLTPLISLLLGDANLSELAWVVVKGETEISVNYGIFLQNIVDFLIMALCIFTIIKAINSAKAKLEKPEEPVEEEPAEPELSAEAKLLTEIKELLANKD